MCEAGVVTQANTNGGVEEWQLICVCAISILENVCERIRTGDISVGELKQIKATKKQMDKLCDAATQGRRNTSMPSAKDLNTSISQRLTQYEHFQTYCEQMNNIILHLSSVESMYNVSLLCDLMLCVFQVLHSFTQASGVSLIHVPLILCVPVMVMDAKSSASLMLNPWSHA